MKNLKKKKKLNTTYGRNLHYFYDSVIDNKVVSIYKVNDFNKLLMNWKNTYPDSEHWAILAAKAQRDYAFKVRGGRYANTVTKSAYEVFYNHIDNMKKFILVAEKLAPSNEAITVLKLDHEKLSKDGSVNGAFKIFNDSLKYSKYNFNAAVSLIGLLNPKWKGSNELVDKFIYSIKKTNFPRIW